MIADTRKQTQASERKAGRAKGATAKLNLPEDRGSAEDRRGNIIEIAAKRFSDFGFEATTVRQIAKDADILSGSLYHHFATKEEILHDIVREVVFRVRDSSLRINEAKVDAEHRLVALILMDLGEMTRNQQVFAIIYNERKLFARSKDFAYIGDTKKVVYGVWRGILEEGIGQGLFNPKLDIWLAIMTIVRMLNAAADWFRNEDAAAKDLSGYTLDQMTDFYLQFILSAIRHPARASEPIPRQPCEELARSSTVAR